MKDKYKVSEEALFVRSKIREQNLDHCLDLTPEQVETVLKLSKEYAESKNEQVYDEELKNGANKFLVIELDSIDKVPRVFYKDKEITGKLRVYFDWETRHESSTNYFPAISIVYIEHDDRKIPYVKAIGYDSLFKERRIDLSLWEKSQGCRTTHSTNQQPGKSAEKLS